MLFRTMARVALCAGVLAAPARVSAQEAWASDDPVLRRIWEIGTGESRVEALAQPLLDSIGPRLTGSPGQIAAHEWAAARFREWGIEARNERYGTWPGWRRGTTHVDLLEPRVRTLDARLLAWSRGSGGAVAGEVVALPAGSSPEAFRAWLPGVRGKFVLLSAPPVTCRPMESWGEWALPATVERLAGRIQEVEQDWRRRLAATGLDPVRLPEALEGAGAVGVLTQRWSGGWGTSQVHDAPTPLLPALDLSCEDYGLLFRLAEKGQGPVLRVDARAEFTGPAPALNTVAEIRGWEKPEEYVLLSAHFDSWDAASGATDNGTGVLVMMEAMRILREAYPRPGRTIVAGLWGGEEQGLNGSRAFAEDHPEVVGGLQALLNQDTGTGRIDRISLQGFTEAGPFFRRWLERLPEPLVGGIELDAPGLPSAGSSDHSSFVCRGAPGFWLLSKSWDYGTYTWHTNRDTYDKISFDDVRRNATLVAMLAYLASEEPERIPRTRRTDLPVDSRTGRPGAWPACRPAVRAVG